VAEESFGNAPVPNLLPANQGTGCHRYHGEGSGESPQPGTSARDEIARTPYHGDEDADQRQIGVSIGKSLLPELDKPDNGYQGPEIPEPSYK
jgi:hypothetical protein